MPTTARGIWTPSDTDAVDFTTDLATMAGTIDNALDLYGNALRGTASQRAAFLSAAVDGMLWQDTDGIRMIWRKDGALWVPAVWRWRGTTAQMNSFGANAPDGFEWYSSTNSTTYVRQGGAWNRSGLTLIRGTGTIGTVAQNGAATINVTYPTAFPAPPLLSVNQNSGRLTLAYTNLTATGFTIIANNWSSGNSPTSSFEWSAIG